mmetsp:Transcript_1365/g.2827  ORF Transcript_1365/g.2827 Transcript_1365/m.2827 type:complete len:239 (+) Transcript_1365:313-1029(+)
MTLAAWVLGALAVSPTVRERNAFCTMRASIRSDRSRSSLSCTIASLAVSSSSTVDDETRRRSSPSAEHDAQMRASTSAASRSANQNSDGRTGQRSSASLPPIVSAASASSYLSSRTWSAAISAAPPPRPGAMRRVSFESRYGTCCAPCDSAFITLERPRSEALMLIASRMRLPVASSSEPDRLTRSDPARSTTLSLPVSCVACIEPTPDVSSTRCRRETRSCSTACERDDDLFILVSA